MYFFTISQLKTYFFVYRSPFYSNLTERFVIFIVHVAEQKKQNLQIFGILFALTYILM
jgi:hypothetical protein